MKDKKKLLVMIVLGVAVLGIGAFQFVNMSGSEPPKTASKSKPKEDAKSEATTQEDAPKPDQQVASLYQMGMNPRDPFQEGQLPLADGMTPPPTKGQQPIPEPPRPTHAHRPNGIRIPSPIQGEGWGPLPAGPNGGGGTSVQPSTPLRQPGEFVVTGVITGAKPAAVFVDANGNQRLVTVGGSLDGDSRLVSVEKGKVTIEHKGKTKTLNVGGTPNVK
jgi:hypothetical protein